MQYYRSNSALRALKDERLYENGLINAFIPISLLLGSFSLSIPMHR
jgi:hypothetical protein